MPGLLSFPRFTIFTDVPGCKVIMFDDGSLSTLREVADLEEYVNQNSSADIRRRREIRMALRALDGRIVSWPYEHIVVSDNIAIMLELHVEKL